LRSTSVSFSDGKIMRKEALREERRRRLGGAAMRVFRGFPCLGLGGRSARQEAIKCRSPDDEPV
jgi:hypothetical protein